MFSVKQHDSLLSKRNVTFRVQSLLFSQQFDLIFKLIPHHPWNSLFTYIFVFTSWGKNVVHSSLNATTSLHKSFWTLYCHIFFGNSVHLNSVHKMQRYNLAMSVLILCMRIVEKQLIINISRNQQVILVTAMLWSGMHTVMWLFLLLSTEAKMLQNLFAHECWISWHKLMAGHYTTSTFKHCGGQALFTEVQFSAQISPGAA